MNDGNSRDNDDLPTGPVQIPLLEDVVDPGNPARKIVRKPKRTNYALDLDPEPPVIGDLFDTPLPDTAVAADAAMEDDSPSADIAAPGQETVDAGAADNAASEVPHKRVEDVSRIFETDSLPVSHVPWSVVDDAFTTDAGPAESAEDRQSRLRAGADRVVDDLVREYSREMVRRLRDELTSLLDEFDIDDPGRPD